MLQSDESHVITQEEHMALYQAEDMIIYKNKSYDLSIPPLEHFFKVAEVESPFSGNCSTNWRGYIAQWIVEHDKLYLFGLQEDDSAPPGGSFESIFPGQNKVFADWFTGELPLFDFSNDNTYEVLSIESGCVLSHKSRQREIPDFSDIQDFILVDDIWIDRLYAWADENDIPDLTWDEEDNIYKGLPRDNSKLLNLACLDLSNNKLIKLPPEIGQLTNLTTLNLGRNYLTELPPEIGQLSNLTTLDLGQFSGWSEHGPYYNSITDFPPEIGQLTNLIYLHLGDNRLSELPPEIGQLTNLIYLNLGINYLTELPPEIGQLSNLTYLNLGKNYHIELPPEIGQLINLTTLDYFGNNLTYFRKELLYASSEEILDHLKSEIKVQKNSKAEIINILAVNGDSTSKPIKIYRTDKDVKLPEKFVLRLDSVADRPDGREALKLSNFNLKLIVIHSKAHLMETLKGFRRDKDGVTFIIAKLHTESMEFY